MVFNEPVIEFINIGDEDIVTASNICKDAYAGGGDTCSNHAYDLCTDDFSQGMA